MRYAHSGMTFSLIKRVLLSERKAPGTSFVKSNPLSSRGPDRGTQLFKLRSKNATTPYQM